MIFKGINYFYVKKYESFGFMMHTLYQFKTLQKFDVSVVITLNINLIVYFQISKLQTA
jgi:hypothetical protein